MITKLLYKVSTDINFNINGINIKLDKPFHPIFSYTEEFDIYLLISRSITLPEDFHNLIAHKLPTGCKDGYDDLDNEIPKNLSEYLIIKIPKSVLYLSGSDSMIKSDEDYVDSIIKSILLNKK